MNLTHAPLRAATGAFILNSGISKLGSDAEAAAQTHGFAATAYPQFKDMDPGQFTKMLAVGEIALGAALLTPKVPSALAGPALAGFGMGLLGLYFRVPGMRQSDGIRPTQQGVPIAKDVWLLGAGATLGWQGVVNGTKRAAKKASRKVNSAAESAHDALPF